ncbi:MAG: hypothetical protein MRQ07_05430 [Candidatus Midichloria sp.]|nr:hypothetical protein [Candidatus Midichloria sp.]
MSKNPQQLVRCLKITAIMHRILIVTMCCIGFMIKALQLNIDSSVAFIYFTANNLPIAIRGLVIVGLLTATMST